MPTLEDHLSSSETFKETESDLKKELETSLSPPRSPVASQTGEIVVISDSPGKRDNVWLDALKLYSIDRLFWSRKRGG